AAAAPDEDAAAPAAVDADTAEPTAPAFSQEQLDQMLAPIALYPDSLLIQLMMSSTYPLELVEADRWCKKNATIKGEAREKALEAEDWDPSVKAMALFPDLLGRMSENLDWTQDLGDAFLGQQPQVLDTVQALRKQAYDAGNLQSGEQQTVVVEKETQVIQIEPAQPETVYVPQYNSAAVYGTPPPAQPYYPEANTYSGTDMLMTGALSFGAGMLIGNLIWDDDSDCDWDDHHVYGGYGGRGGHNEIKIEGDVNIGNQVGSGNRPGVGNRPGAGGDRQSWQHNPSHRRGVNYRDTKTRQTFANQPGARPSLDRNAALGYNRDTLGSGGGTGKVGGAARPSVAPSKIGGGVPSKGAAPSKVGSAKSAPKVAAKAPSKATVTKKPTPSAATQKRPTSSIGSAGGNRPTAVGGLGGGSATRAASARGASSRGGGGGGGSKLGGGGGGGGRGGRR
ncbi:MAG TPA: DUF3300 domain-containing protein, partial [Candidatus Binatia bacterium]|nr:DUF3300 domain-containing protein [Candidatus Binatia bacterium]